jgi:hypothetical protein
LQPLAKDGLGRKVPGQLGPRAGDLRRRRHDRRQFLSLLQYQSLVYQQPQRAVQLRGTWIIERRVRLQRQLPHQIRIRDQLSSHAAVDRGDHLVDDLLRLRGDCRAKHKHEN